MCYESLPVVPMIGDGDPSERIAPMTTSRLARAGLFAAVLLLALWLAFHLR